jgi:hypothetical protein
MAARARMEHVTRYLCLFRINLLLFYIEVFRMMIIRKEGVPIVD